VVTLTALAASATVLKVTGGVLCAVCYPGHPAGAIKATTLKEWMAEQAAKDWWIAKYGALHTRRPAPFLLLART